MDMSTVLIVPMGVMMGVICGGMIAGAVWAMVRRRRSRDQQ